MASTDASTKRNSFIDQTDRKTVSSGQFSVKKGFVMSVVFNIFMIASLLTIILLIFFLGTPVQRGIVCDDPSLAFPYYDSTIPYWMVVLVGCLFWSVAIGLTEGRRYVQWKQGGEIIESEEILAASEDFTCSPELSIFLVNVGRNIAIACYGHLCIEMIVIPSKFVIGRQRPHFMTICNPDKSSPLYNCSTFIPASLCQQDSRLKEAQLSFPSGHASFAIFAAVYTCLYLQARFQSKGLFVRSTFQLAALLWAIFVCNSRIADYKHHFTDVLVGGVIGAIGAILISLKIIPSYLNCGCNKTESHSVNKKCLQVSTEDDSDEKNVTTTTTTESLISSKQSKQ